MLAKGWKTSKDRAVTVTGDINGLHVLVADESSGYAWRTAATLIDNSPGADQWVGQACITGSGNRAAVVYAPRTYSNHETAMQTGASVATVDLRHGTVQKLAVHASLAYFNPGCGADETFAVSSLSDNGNGAQTTIDLIDAASGKITSVAVDGQVTSAVPMDGDVVAALGHRLVDISHDGTVSTLATSTSTPFRLHPDSAGGVAYEVASSTGIEVRRFAHGKSRLLGHGAPDRIRLTASAGHIYVLGADRGAIALKGLSGWHAIDAPVDADISTLGHLAVKHASHAKDAAPRFDQPLPVTIAATVLANKKDVSFTVKPEPGSTTDGAPSTASQPSPFATTPLPENDTTDPDSACAVVRNDVHKQAYQASAAQVEWAVDRAVLGDLTITRPADWKGAGNKSYTIQGSGGLFPILPIDGGGSVPPQVLLGVLAQESNTLHASPHAVDGETGNFNQGGFYGDWVSWGTVDCGYGIGQVTTGMAKADGDYPFNSDQRLAIATDYAANIAASLNILIQKWNELWEAGIRPNLGDPQYIENWYMAAWDYNSGLEPNAGHGNTTGCVPSPTCTDSDGAWGLGWFNNPANPIYPVDRESFNGWNSYDAIHPNLWPYQEKVLGWAYHPVARYDYVNHVWEPAFSAAAVVATNSLFLPALPGKSQFCTLATDNCEPGAATDVNGNPGSGQCDFANLHCWWPDSVTWTACSQECGTSLFAYNAGAAEPSDPTVYPATCDMSLLPSGARIVDDVDTPDPVGTCQTGQPPSPWDGQSAGKFTLTFAQSVPEALGCYVDCITFQSKIDFHQIGGTGFNGHFWFTHTVPDQVLQPTLKVTGTWRLNAPNAWTRLFVHIPAIGAQTHQADYTINLPNGKQKHRAITTSYEKDAWVELGVYDMRGTSDPTVELSNITKDGDGSQDIAWDALAYVPLTAKPANFVVAIGDSYTSGEGTGSYYHETDQYGDTPSRREACRRSPNAWPRQVVLPGKSSTIGSLADSWNPDMAFSFVACSGARVANLASVDESWNKYNGSMPGGQWGELAQLDQGVIDENTTLILLTIGGNDAGFADVFHQCFLGACPTEQSLDDTIDTSVVPLIKEIISEIRERAPQATILIAGYPPALDRGTSLDAGACTLTSFICDGVQFLNYGLSANEAAMLNRVAGYLFEKAIPRDEAGPIYGIPTFDQFSGHAVYDWTDGDYVNGLTMPELVNNHSGEQSLPLGTSDPGAFDPGMGSFHPTADGAKYGQAKAVTDFLNSPANGYTGSVTINLNAHSGPSTSDPVVETVPIGTPVHVYCTERGTVVNGTDVWDLIGTEPRYVSDAYVHTGYNLTAQPCKKGPAPGSVDASLLTGCDSATQNATTNYGGIYSPSASWYFQDYGQGCSSTYYYVYGKGETPSSAFARWGYYPGAFAVCNLSVTIPEYDGHQFDRSAYYQIVTGADHASVVGEVPIDQNIEAGNADVDLGTFAADGSGYLGIRLDDRSSYGDNGRVVASTVHFNNCQSVT